MTKLKRGDVWLADLNPRIGTEPEKTRPVVIVQSDFLNEIHPSAVICPITTNVELDAEILRVHLTKKEAGLDKESDILVDQLRAIDNKRFIRKLGTLNNHSQNQLQKNILIVLDLSA